MHKFCRSMVIIVLALLAVQAFAQDRALYQPYVNFYGKPDTVLTLDFSKVDHPASLDLYNPVFHLDPVRQDTTNTCWSFAATSLLESELHRLGRGEIALSRMHTVYWEYVEKVRRFVQQKGKSLVAPGSQPNAVILRMQAYGAMPADTYTGLLADQTVLDERKMLREIKDYLNYIKTHELWHEEQASANVRMIMDRYMGAPPETFMYKGRSYTALSFAKQVLQLPLADYVSVISTLKYPFWTRNSYPVPDNWWDSHDYCNVPLENFYQAIKTAINNGYSLVIAGDVSEAGKYGPSDMAIVPSFDIPAEYINQDAREFRFANGTTEDDHGMHLVGYKSWNGEDWFLIKDSAAAGWHGALKGYHFFRGDYIRLKILAIMAHKDALTDLLNKYDAMQNRKQ